MLPGMTKLDIGKAIRTARTKRAPRGQRDQVSFAGALGISQGHLSRLENGKGDPSLFLLVRAAEVAGIDVSRLVALGEE